MLCPGDRLFVPARRPREETAPTSQRTRYEVMPDIRYFKAQVGLQVMFGPNAPGEGRGR